MQGIKSSIQKFKTAVENVNLYPRDFKLSQLFENFSYDIAYQ